MTNHEIRGKQRQAVYASLTGARSASQIFRYARQAAPKITLQDVRPILRSFEAQGIIKRIGDGNGAIYITLSDEPLSRVNQEEFALLRLVVRARNRTEVLKHLSRNRMDYEPLPTATQIKKELRDSTPLGLNHVIRTLSFLVDHRLAQVVGRTTKRDMKIYGITDLGARILELLRESD